MKISDEPKVVTGLMEWPGDGLNMWQVTITIPGHMKNALRRTIIAKSHQQAKKMYIEYNARCNGAPEQSLKKWSEHLRKGHIKARRINRVKKLKVYFAYDMDPEYGTVLVFDYDIRSAKVRGYNGFPFTPEEYLSFRCKRADDKYMAFTESDQPHVVDSYEPDVETWQEAYEVLYEN